MAKRPELIVLNGSLATRRFEVTVPLRLGRSSSNDIPIPDEELSRNHCLFEPVGEDGIRVTDLASANGTLVNGRAIGTEARLLKAGDLVEVGTTRLQVGDAPAPSATVDLGLGGAATAANGERATATSVRRKPPYLLLVALLVFVGAMALVLFGPDFKPTPAAPKALSSAEKPAIISLSYEKVKADSHGIFRYFLSLSSDGILSVRIDDTLNNRHMPAKRTTLSEESRRELNEILDFDAVSALARETRGIEPDPPALESLVLKVVYATDVREASVINADESEAFAAIREKLEAFSKSELGVWAIAYSRARLVELAEEATRLARAKWDERDVHDGNLFAAISAYEEALFYLETVNPKPACAAEAKEGLARAKKELDARYVDQRFRADRALNLSQWEEACAELKVLLEMVPDRKDPRNRDARQKLISAETNLKKGGK